jgi:hypothetical protein
MDRVVMIKVGVFLIIVLKVNKQHHLGPLEGENVAARCEAPEEVKRVKLDRNEIGT